MHLNVLMEYIVSNERQATLWRYKYELYDFSLVDFPHQIVSGCFMSFTL